MYVFITLVKRLKNKVVNRWRCFIFSKHDFSVFMNTFMIFFQQIGYIWNRRMPLNQGLYIFLQILPYKNSSKNFLSEKTIGGETIISNQIKNQLFAEDKCFCDLFHSEEYFQSCLIQLPI